MKRKRGNPLLFVIILVIGMAVIAAEIWFFHGIIQKRQITRAIDRAWSQTVTADTPEYLLAIDERSGYEIEKIKKGEIYEITVTVHGVDLGGTLKRIPPDKLHTEGDEGDINDYLISLIEESEPTEITTVIYATAEDGGYHIQFSDTFVDAMSGMVYSYTRDLVDAWTEGY